MGQKFTNLVGYGKTKREAFNNFQQCFIFHHGSHNWKTMHTMEYVKNEPTIEQHYIKEYLGRYYPLFWIKGEEEYYKCYVSE